MRRRTFFTATPIAVAAMLPSHDTLAAEQAIGWISADTRETAGPAFDAFKAGLRSIRGGDDVRILERYATGGPGSIAVAVSELQQKGVKLIVCQGPATVQVARAKPLVPLVFGFSGDPIVAGLAASLARPGGNATGITFMMVELTPKRIDFLRTVLPSCRKAALLSNELHAGEELEIVACQRALEQSGVELAVYRVREAAQIVDAIERALNEGAQALVVLPSSTIVRQASTIVMRCLARGVPVVSGWASMAHAGALLTYGPNLHEGYRKVAYFVTRLLDGAVPSDLPIEQPTTFELVINMKTAKALGITIPASILARADEVIE